MDELLSKLLESEILTSDIRDELQNAYNAHLAKVVEEARQEESVKVRSELVEQWIKEREVLVEAIDAQVSDFLAAELQDLKQDISNFRDLEAEYAGKLVESRAQMAVSLQDDMAQLVVQLDQFMEQQLIVEMNELKQDLLEAKQNNFGRKIVEAFKAEYMTHFVDESSVQAKLNETSSKLDEVNAKFEQMAKENRKLQRDNQLAELLTPLSGTKREVMETLLANVSTDKLTETYSKFIGRVLNETVQPMSEKETTVLSEAKITNPRVDSNVIIKTGDATNSAPLTESAPALDPELVAQLKRFSGQA